MTRVYLIRHGETEWNKIGRFQGQSDVPLSSLGVEQAEAIAKYAQLDYIERLYASDLSRAVETARPLAQKYGLAIETDEAFRELHFGEWEGRYFVDINDKYPGQMQYFYTAPEKITIPGSESFADFEQRTTTKLKEIVDANRGKTIAVVSHGAAIRVLVAKILQMPLNAIWHMAQYNTAINSIVYEPDGFVYLERLNDTQHLQHLR